MVFAAYVSSNLAASSTHLARTCFWSQRFVTIGYIAVDAFLLLTGFLFGLQAVKRGLAEYQHSKSSTDVAKGLSSAERQPNAPSGCCCAAHRMGWYRRFVRIMPPMILAIAVHCALLFRHGLYPLGVVRSEARVDLQRFAADPFADGTPPSNSTDLDPEYGMCNNGCGSWWANLLQAQSLVPFGGVMIHTWTVVTQYMFYMTFPLLTKNTTILRKARLPLACLFVLACSGLVKLVGFVHVSGMAHNTIVRGVLSFFWYAFPAARIGVVYAGVALAWLLHAWESGSRPRVQAAVDWLLGTSSSALCARSLLWAVVAVYVHQADADFGSSQSALLATLLHVGSVGSAVAWGWLVLLAVTGTPVLGTPKLQSVALHTASKDAPTPPTSQQDPPSTGPRQRVRSRSVSDFLQLPARGLTAPSEGGGENSCAAQASKVTCDQGVEQGSEGGQGGKQGGVSLRTRGLSWGGFTPLARLSYLTYLSHCMVMVFMFSHPDRLMPQSEMPLPAPRPNLKPHTVTAGNIGFWINGTWPLHGGSADFGQAAWAQLDHDAISRKWMAAPAAVPPRSVLPSKNAAPEAGGEAQLGTVESKRQNTPPGCWAADFVRAEANGVPGAFSVVDGFQDEKEYPTWAPRQLGSAPPSVQEFWASTALVITLTFALCWVADMLVVTPLTRVLLLPPVAKWLQWPVLAYSVLVLAVGVLAHTAMAVWYLAYATPWTELGGAGVLHVLPQSPLVRAYHAFHFGVQPPA